MFKRSFRPVVIIAFLGLLLIACSSGPTGGPAPSEPLSFVVDPHLTPGVPSVPGLQPGDPPRPVGATVDHQGLQSDFVLHELMVLAPSQSNLDDLLTRWGGVVVDQFEIASRNMTIFLVRVDADRAGPDTLVEDLLEADPNLHGEQRISSIDALNLVAIAAREAAQHGAQVSLNLLPEEEAIIDGSTEEGPNGPSTYDPDAFQWPYMNIGSTQNIGVGSAWRLLAEEDKLTGPIPMMIVDNGFQLNNDIPSQHSIHYVDWDELETTHGTDVIVAAMGIPDNAYGAAGPAGPVATLTAVQRADAWGTLVRFASLSSISEGPQIINMSHTFTFTNILASLRDCYTFLFEAIYDMGHLMFAAAGNQGDEIDPNNVRRVPCQLEVVICVGGMAWNSTNRASGSNYGIGQSQASVEIYGPYSVWSVENPLNSSLTGARLINGTSFASPFVAGVAALVRSADPALSNEEVRQLLMETAHVGGLGSEVTGYQRRVNAFGAVAHALGYQEWPDPSISITATSSTGSVSTGFPLGEEIWFEATAVDHRGVAVPTVTWTIMGQEIETGPSPGGQHIVIDDALEVGSYAITATATDLGGYQATATIDIEVTYEPPEVFITNPKVNQVTWANETLNLAGQGLSGNGLLPESNLAWRVMRVTPTGNTTVHSALGSTSTVPAAVMQTGSYQIRLTGQDDVETVSRSINITAIPKPPEYPTASIISPEDDSVYASGSSITFSGSGTDPEDGILSGTAFRWTATHPGGEIVLCEGNAFSGHPLPVQNCSSFAATLDSFQLPGVATLYSITLEVMDSDGNVDDDDVNIRVLVPAVP